MTKGFLVNQNSEIIPTMKITTRNAAKGKAVIKQPLRTGITGWKFATSSKETPAYARYFSTEPERDLLCVPVLVSLANNEFTFLVILPIIMFTGRACQLEAAK
jgi:hypothetical protein